jgi:hypothetical protein
MQSYSRNASVMISRRCAWLPRLPRSDTYAFQIVSTDDYMPMPISNLDEYEKVVNVSWFTPDKPLEELRYKQKNFGGPRSLLTDEQLSMCPAILADVPPLLYRYSEFFKPVLFLLRRSLSAT